MAYVEHFLYGTGERPDGGRSVLARTSGLTKDVALEIVRRCEGWRLSAAEAAGAPVLLSVPLATGYPADSARLYAAVRIAVGAGRPMCHALVLSEADYAGFGFNPFRLERDGFFLQSWAPGLALEHREGKASTLAPLVVRLPDAQDAELVDEALRRFLTSGLLRLPIARPDAASDRFLALLLASLPHVHKRKLRFASFVPHEPDDYTICAFYRADASFRSWRHDLMTTVHHPLPTALEEYVAAVRRFMVAGDLMGLERLSRSLEGSQAGAETAVRSVGPQLVSSTITTCAEPVEEMPTWQQTRTADGRGAEGEKLIAANRAEPQGNVRPPAAGPHHGPAGTKGGGIGRQRGGWLGVALALLGLFAAGLGLLGRQNGGSPRAAATAGQTRAATAAERDRSAAPRGDSVPVLPGQAPGAGVEAGSAERITAPVRASGAPASGGVLELGPLYASEIEAYRRQLDGNSGAEQRRAAAGRALASLEERGGENLRRAALRFCEDIGAGIRTGDQPAQAAALARKQQRLGTALTSELRRLVMATIALQSEAPWLDLGDLDQRRLTARWDSLVHGNPALVYAVTRERGLANVLPDLASATAAAGARAVLTELLAKDRRGSDWVESLERAATDLGAGVLPAADAAYRAAAFGLVRLKRAEELAGFAELPFTAGYARPGWYPVVVYEALAALRVDLSGHDAALLPPLAADCVEFHDGLLRMQEVLQGTPSAEQLSEAIATLTANRAVSFDAEVYGPHIERCRLEAAKALLTQGRPPEAVPLRFFPADQRQVALEFLGYLKTGASAQAWRALAQSTQEPFLRSWAERLASAAASQVSSAAPAATDLVADDPFSEGFQELARAAADLAAQAQRGRDWSAAFVALRGQAREYVQRFRSHGRGLEGRQRLARVENLLSSMQVTLPVQVTGLTVELPAPVLSAPSEVYADLLAPGGELVLRTPALAMELTADGAWRGSRAVQGDLAIAPGQSLRAVLRRVSDGRVLGEAIYDETVDGMAPGALTRARPLLVQDARSGADTANRGTIAFVLADWFWRRLKLPDLRQPVALDPGET